MEGKKTRKKVTLQCIYESTCRGKDFLLDFGEWRDQECWYYLQLFHLSSHIYLINTIQIILPCVHPMSWEIQEEKR